jgi:hypothetical protein
MHARIAFLLFSIKVVAAGNSLSFVRSLAPSVYVCAPNLNFRSSSSSSSSNLHSTLLRCAKLSQEIINSCVFEPLNRPRRINIYVCAYNQRRRQRRALILLFRHNYNERPVYIYMCVVAVEFRLLYLMGVGPRRRRCKKLIQSDNDAAGLRSIEAEVDYCLPNWLNHKLFILISYLRAANFY